MTKEKVIVIGSGFSGAFIARELAEKGHPVEIIERRPQIAGQMFDQVDEETGCLVHEYGPHIFHTDDEEIWEWLNKFSKFESYKLRTQVLFDSKEDWFTCSFGFHTVDKLFPKEKAEKVKHSLLNEFPNRNTVSIPELLQSENKLVKEFANILWEDDYKPYTSKQWGISPEDVDPDILKRVPVYMNYFDKIHNNKYEALPAEGYTKLFENIFNHENISIELNVDGMSRLEIEGDKVLYKGEPAIVVFTGAIDELFNFKHGELGYRSLRFEKEVTVNDKNTKDGDPCVDVYPDHKYGYTRITNFGKVPIQNDIEFQISSKEYSMKFERGKNLERYYPLSTLPDKEILSMYLKDAENVKGLYLSGRLADYKYYDMDKALIAAREKLDKILSDFK